MLTPSRAGALAALASLALLACGDDTAGSTALASLEVTSAAGATAPASSTVTATVVARTAGGGVAPGVALTARVSAGGGAIATAAVTTDDAGQATVSWTLGVAPVNNRLELTAADGISGGVDVVAAVGDEPVPAAFGDVNAFLTGLGRDGSTEGLAFGADGTLLIGVPEGLAVVDADGTAHAVALGGATVASPLGLAAGADGATWVCDAGAGALLEVSAAGVARVVIDHDGDDALETPNAVAVGPDGRVYLSDSCLGRLYQLDPASGAVLDRVQLDLASQGSPNGLAFDDAGRLWFTTENTGLLCGHSDVELTAPIAGLFRVDVGADGFGAPVAVAPGVGLFGDGLAFDAEGNLFAIFDTAEGLSLDESIVFVLRAGETELTRFFGVKGQILANLAFGQGAYGEGTLYFTLLSVPPFVPAEARGLVRLPIGLAGRPLP